jgi:pimeloyl-ACP methyl ester carboxylesterase
MMLPFYFGAGRRRLFGVYDSARGAAATAPAAVLCYPSGEEYVHAHRTMRRLAIKLGAAGIHALRFDYFGTGDSSGETAEADFKGWVADVEMAIDELRDMTGATKVVLIGLRLGATLAATVAVKRPRETDALVLWDPVVSGEEYLETIYRSAMSDATVKSNDPGEARQIGGSDLTPTMATELSTLNLPAMIPALPARTLIILTEVLCSHSALDAVIREQGSESIVVEHMQDIRPWVEDFSKVGAIPATVLRRIVQWLR